MRLFIREKILIVEETHDKKKEEGKPKISGEKNVSTKVFRVLYVRNDRKTSTVIRGTFVKTKS